MKNVFKLFAIFAFAIFIASCGSRKPEAPSTFIQTNDVGWSSIQLRDGLTYDKAFDDVLDVVAKRFEMDIISKEGSYARSQWNYRWGSDGNNYRTRVVFKFSADKTKVDVKTEAEWNVGGSRWVSGYDTRLLETVKQDIMGVVARTTM